MSCTLSSFHSPSLILLPPQLTHNLDLSAVSILLQICYTLRCVKDFSPMALLQANKKKSMNNFFSFIDIHTPLSRAQDITRRNTAGWRFRNKYHTNTDALHYTYQVLLECTHLNVYVMWDFPSQGVFYAPVPTTHPILIQDQATIYTCTFLGGFGVAVVWANHGKKEGIRMGHKNVQHETAVHAGDSIAYFVQTFSKENARDY